MDSIKGKMYPLAVFFLGALLIGGVYFSFFAPKEVDMGVSIPHTYSDVDELKKEADLIIEGKTLNKRTWNHQGVPFTLSRVKVGSILAGKPKSKVIRVLETGGMREGKHWTVEHNRVMEKEQDYVLFLRTYEGPVTNEESYVIVGAYQGKFQVEGQRVTPPAEVEKGLAGLQSKNQLITDIKK
ncbi:hypothetical protein [Paludifilum halophilum]|uniref:Uncharacterized protein n=1 Tax=Paludifilum halophilum TaxID=1642702 RepID=A0A235B6P3_9BACL|nr:hypothetical protein [Paludifilum halophilum]OYD07970.1 hypothetical protein CHM34_07570 [Paludifilum halophilum]